MREVDVHGDSERIAGGTVPALACERDAQGTLEYAVTVIALIAVVSALALLWRAGESGGLVELAREAASHALDASGALDIPLF